MHSTDDLINSAYVTGSTKYRAKRQAVFWLLGTAVSSYACVCVCVCSCVCIPIHYTFGKWHSYPAPSTAHAHTGSAPDSPLPGVSFVVNLNNNKHACQVLLWSLASFWAALCRTSFVPVTSFLCSREAFTTRSTSRAGARRIHLLCLLTDQVSLHRSRNP